MPKSVGAKRRNVEGHIDRILELFNAYEESENAKIFKTTDFGYRRIQIERPLRLDFQNSDERLERVKKAKSFQNLAASKKRDSEARANDIEAGQQKQAAILAALRSMPSGLIQDAEVFAARLKKALKTAGLKVPAALKKAITNALSERDETALPVIKKERAAVHATESADRIDERHGIYGLEQDNGAVRIVEYEPDAELRDHENVPLDQDVDAYFEAEVAPHVPDAWINPTFTDHKDGLIGKVGYSINFNRYFYRYQPPRDLDKIDTDIKAVESEILAMLKEVTA